MPITTTRLHEMADQLREVARGESGLAEMLAELRDGDLEELTLQGEVALTHARVLAHMLKQEAWCRANAPDRRQDELRYSRKSWEYFAHSIRRGAQHGARLARERGDLPLPMKIYVIGLVRTWKLVVELDDEIQLLDAPADAA